MRQLALAAIPVVLLAQCAPQCAPEGTLTNSDGRTIVVESLDAAQNSGVFVLDAGATEWRQIGFTTGGAPCGLVDCEDALISDSGTTIAFDVTDDINPEQAWAVAASGPTLVSVTPGARPATATARCRTSPRKAATCSSPRSRRTCTAALLTRPTGSTSRDLQAGTTTLLPLLVVDAQPTLSADAQRVASATPATLPSSGGGAVLTTVAAVFDRTTGRVTKLLPTGTAADTVFLGPIQISDNGRRVLWNRGDPNSDQPIVERVDFIGG